MSSHLVSNEDLQTIIKNAQAPLLGFKKAHILITGATGFFGKWLVQALLEADDKLGLGLHLHLLVRNSASWKTRHPEWASHKKVSLVEGDLLNFTFSPPHLQYIFHLATPASAKLNEEDPLLMWETNVQGMKNILELARKYTGVKVLFTSSGAVYGDQPPSTSHLSEESLLGPQITNPRSAYAEGKRSAEHLATLYFKKYGVQTFLARCFCFVGPHLPLDKHFAIGNFVLNALRHETILVGGDGRPMRSYMYPTDLIEWLLQIVHSGEPIRPYNVGSEEAYSIKHIAESVAEFSGTQVVIQKQATEGTPIPRYIPSTERVRQELGLKLNVGLPEAIEKTLDWYKRT